MATVNGTITTTANTWHQVPISPPTELSELKVTLEVITGGTIRWAFDNTGTPSATNGLLAPGELIVNLIAGDKIYYASSVSGDTINYTIRTL